MTSAKNAKLSDAEIATENVQQRRKIKQNIKNYEKIGAKTTKKTIRSPPYSVWPVVCDAAVPPAPQL
jgi:hypothetical protein